VRGQESDRETESKKDRNGEGETETEKGRKTMRGSERRGNIDVFLVTWKMLSSARKRGRTSGLRGLPETPLHRREGGRERDGETEQEREREGGRERQSKREGGRDRAGETDRWRRETVGEESTQKERCVFHHLFFCSCFFRFIFRIVYGS